MKRSGKYIPLTFALLVLLPLPILGLSLGSLASRAVDPSLLGMKRVTNTQAAHGQQGTVATSPQRGAANLSSGESRVAPQRSEVSDQKSEISGQRSVCSISRQASLALTTGGFPLLVSDSTYRGAFGSSGARYAEGLGGSRSYGSSSGSHSYNGHGSGGRGHSYSYQSYSGGHRGLRHRR
jgi:hypothetical protein